MLQNIIEFLFLTLISVSVATAAVTLEYSDEGVLRKDGNCNIMFTNFGGENTILNQSVKKSVDKVYNTFNITLTGLTNANLGLNNDTQFNSPEDLQKYVKVTQNGEEITTLEYFNYEKETENGKFDLRIYNLINCDGLKIKQTFKDELVSVANRLYYVNVVPETINQAFKSELFGPSYSFPFERIHWKFNEGLEDLRKTCGIHMLFKGFVKDNSSKQIKHHWQYYLSTDSINSKNCTVPEFFEVIKRNYVDYHYTSDLLGENYMGYVFKREGHVEVHMDGVIANNHYIIEVYQQQCNENSESRTSCTVKSDNELSFLEFTEQMIHECMSETIDENYIIDWSIKNGKATGKLINQIIEIEIPKKDKKGKLPPNVDGQIEYVYNSDENTTPVARFVVTLKCGDGTFMNDICQCQACAKHCAQCNNAFTCLKCEESEAIIMDEEYSVCIGVKGYFEDPVDDILEQCNPECSECNNSQLCTVCKDPKAVMSDGVCLCPFSYLNSDGFCAECEPGCAECNKDGCIVCSDESKVPENGHCN